MSKEIELKFKVSSFRPIIERLRLIGAKLEWRGQEEVFYYDTLGRQLRETNKILRFCREPNGRNVLSLKTIKNVHGMPSIRYEYQFSTEHFKETHRILRHMGYSSYFNYTTARQRWRVGSACVDLDTIDGHRYIQIEGNQKITKQLIIILELDSNSAIVNSYEAISGKSKTA